MAEDRIERRLAAILAADVVGYSRLMEANEEGTLSALKRHRREFLDPLVARHGGRIFKVMGDGLLVEFGSVLSAARCAVEVQRGMAERNAGVPEDRHIRFRIGLNVGDLIVEGDDFYGDGVNLAARLEGLAWPGGIACSAAVRQQIGSRLELGFRDQGLKAVKNLAEPVHVYFIDLGMEDGAAPAGSAAARPDRPSVAVLPFANMSHDPEQEFFSDGITEDIITDLSKVSGLFVLGRNTVFTYKGRAVNLERVASELGVAYLLEGSVRKAGNRVRITAQLIEGATGGHVWAERYDRDLTDLFAVQDEISAAIVDQLKVRLLPEERRAIERPPTVSIEAYECYLRGRQLAHTRAKSSLEVARRLFVRATEIDPTFARAYAGLADTDALLRFAHNVDIPIEAILASADRALALDPTLGEAHAARASALGDAGRDAEAREAFERALALEPNSFIVNYYFGEFCFATGAREQAAVHLARAAELHPHDYKAGNILQMILRALGREREARAHAEMALERARRAREANPDSADPLRAGATLLAALGRRDEAIDWITRALLIDPDDAIILCNAAFTYAVLGETERAIDLIERALPRAGAGMVKWLREDADLDPLRGHPRFVALLAARD